MAGEIQLNSTTMATESSGSITAQLDTIRPNTTNGSLTLQGDSSDAGVTGLTIDSSGNATFAGTAKSDTIKPKTTDASLTLQGDSSGSGVTGITIDSSGVVNTTTAKVTNIQATSGQSLTIKDEDGNAAITIGTDNTAASYLSLNFGSYHGDSSGAGSGTRTGNTLSDYEEGTWTPTLKGTTTTGTYGYDTARTNGVYTKIGNQVFVKGSVRVSSITSAGEGSAAIGGLPFNVSVAGLSSYTRMPSPLLLQSGPTISSTSIFAATETSNDLLYLYYQSSTNITAIAITDADFLNAIWAFKATYTTS